MVRNQLHQSNFRNLWCGNMNNEAREGGGLSLHCSSDLPSHAKKKIPMNDIVNMFVQDHLAFSDLGACSFANSSILVAAYGFDESRCCLECNVCDSASCTEHTHSGVLWEIEEKKQPSKRACNTSSFTSTADADSTTLPPQIMVCSV